MRIAGKGLQVTGISVINQHKSYSLNERLVKKIAAHILKFCKTRRPIELELIFLDDRSIKILNKKYKGRDRATDVLAFNIDRRDFGRDANLAEAYISIDRAAENAEIYGTRLEEELFLYVIHAILHIAGYDDGSAAARGKMLEKQYEILSYLWKKENLSKVLMPR
ncbi:MAG: rRNA maturation RNase YbeY [Candidatus Omnitrophota bacterium]|nr:rRNA maturation RNase YbeY [Candidatus Omnitrophota bacterium]